jgi:hypothetical protein
LSGLAVSTWQGLYFWGAERRVETGAPVRKRRERVGGMDAKAPRKACPGSLPAAGVCRTGRVGSTVPKKGGRPGRQSSFLALMTILFLDNVECLRISPALFFSDVSFQFQDIEIKHFVFQAEGLVRTGCVGTIPEKEFSNGT